MGFLQTQTAGFKSNASQVLNSTLKTTSKGKLHVIEENEMSPLKQNSASKASRKEFRGSLIVSDGNQSTEAKKPAFQDLINQGAQDYLTFN
jgi:hypothetical protein